MVERALRPAVGGALPLTGILLYTGLVFSTLSRTTTRYICMSSDADARVAKYAEDLSALVKAARQAVSQMRICATGRCATLTGPAAVVKCADEVRKLSTWLQKHQDEMLRDKLKLVEISASLFKLANNAHEQHRGAEDRGTSSLFDQILALHEVLMSLPEGKLVNSTGKGKVLKALEALRGLDDGRGGSLSSTTSAEEVAVTTWELLDIGSSAAEVYY